MKTVNLTIKERITALEMLNTGKFSNSTLAVIFGDIKKFNITDEEFTEAGMEKKYNETNGTTTMTWDDENVNKDVDLDQGTIDALLEIIKQKSDAKEFTLGDMAVLNLEKKLTA